MSDLLEQGAAWLASQRAAHLSRQVTYSRPAAGSGQAAEVEVSATVGKTDFAVDDGYGVVQTWQSRDYLIVAADLVLDGETILPRPGDRITDAGVTYEVLAPGKEDVYRFSDPYGLTLRVHTKGVE